MKNGLTKKDSSALYGLAILMMIYHHLFSAPTKWENGTYFSIINSLFGSNIEQRIAWLFRLCVPIYAFISGYGICTIISKKDCSKRLGFNSIFQNYLLALKQILKLMKKYWIVFIIFIPMGVFFFHKSLIGPQTFTLSLLGLKNDYNYEWWYIAQYMMMLTLFPIFDFLLCNLVFFVHKHILEKYKYGKLLILGLLFLVGILFLFFRNAPIFSFLISLINNGRFTFTVVFFEGFLCAFFHIFELGCNNKTYQKLKPFFAFTVLFACLTIRFIRAYDAAYCKYDAFISVPIIYSIVVLLSYLEPIKKFLGYLGKYSTYMWLTHSFFCIYYFSKWVLAARVSFFMFVWTTILSLLTAVILTFIENRINALFLK